MVKATETDSSSKKRKKTLSSSESIKTDDDIYQKVVLYEENEARTRSADVDATLYCRTCENIREILSEIEQLKNEDTEENRNLINEKRITVSTLFVVLKKLNRLEKIRTKASRDALHKEKQRVDSTQLQLYNLLYELEHLKKEITKCLQFKSKDEEIDLVTVEEFYQEAPKEIARENVTKTDEHQLRLARLEWELRQRKQLSELYQQLQRDKAQVATQIVNKQERLDGLAPRLNQILDVTKPLQEYLELSSETQKKQHELAYLLPDPLFLLFYHTDAYNQVYDKNATVTICGDEDEAKQIKNSISELNTDSDSDPEAEELAERTSKRHHRKISRSDRHEEKRNRLLAVHPLSVKVTYKETWSDKETAELQISWFYYPQLHIITSKCEVVFSTSLLGVAAEDVISKETVLSELFEGDNGEDSPNTANHYQLRQVGLEKFPDLLDQVGHPYIWAQKVCGLDFLKPAERNVKPLPIRELSQSSVEIVMKAIKNRFKSRLILAKQIQAFERGNLNLESLQLQDYSDKIRCSLEQWKRAEWIEFVRHSASKPFIEQQMIEPGNILYKATLVRGKAKLFAYIAIRNDFPIQKPIFCVVLNWNGEWNSNNSDAIRDIERSINIDWDKKTFKKNETSYILSAQIRKLMACFDIYLETSNSDVFPQEKIFFKAVRGRNRARPYKYLKIGGGIFTQ